MVPTGLALVATPIGPALARNGENEAEPPVHAEFPTQDPARVREVVGKAHTDLEAVRRIVAASPELAKAVRFQVEGGRVVSLTVHDPVPLVTAVRSK